LPVDYYYENEHEHEHESTCARWRIGF